MPQAAHDWAAIEATAEFKQLARSRQRFAAIAGAIGFGSGLLYILLVYLAPDAMASTFAGGMSWGFAAGIGLVILTFVISALYARRSRQVWAPMEQSIRDRWSA